MYFNLSTWSVVWPWAVHLTVLTQLFHLLKITVNFSKLLQEWLNELIQVRSLAQICSSFSLLTLSYFCVFPAKLPHNPHFWQFPLQPSKLSSFLTQLLAASRLCVSPAKLIYLLLRLGNIKRFFGETDILHAVVFSTCSWLLPSWPSSSLYCFPYLRLHLFVLLVLTHCPGLLKLLQPPFHLVNKHSGSSEFQYSGLLTDSSSILHSWPRGGLWALSALWVQASPVIFDLCCCPTPAPWNYSSCLLVFAPAALLYFGSQFYCMSWILTLLLIDSYFLYS